MTTPDSRMPDLSAYDLGQEAIEMLRIIANNKGLEDVSSQKPMEGSEAYLRFRPTQSSAPRMSVAEGQVTVAYEGRSITFPMAIQAANEVRCDVSFMVGTFRVRKSRAAVFWLLGMDDPDLY